MYAPESAICSKAHINSVQKRTLIDVLILAGCELLSGVHAGMNLDAKGKSLQSTGHEGAEPHLSRTLSFRDEKVSGFEQIIPILKFRILGEGGGMPVCIAISASVDRVVGVCTPWEFGKRGKYES